MGVHRVDDRVEREVDADELQSADDTASEAAHSGQVGRSSEAPADALLHGGGVVELLSTLLDLPLQGSLARLLRQAEERVAPGLAEDVLDGGLRHLLADHLVDHHLLDLGRDVDVLPAELVLDHPDVVLDGLGVPLAGDVQGVQGDRLGAHPAVGSDPAREDVGRGAHVAAELIRLLASEFLLHPVHDGCDPAVELFPVCHHLTFFRVFKISGFNGCPSERVWPSSRSCR